MTSQELESIFEIQGYQFEKYYTKKHNRDTFCFPSKAFRKVVIDYYRDKNLLEFSQDKYIRTYYNFGSRDDLTELIDDLSTCLNSFTRRMEA